MGNMFAGLSSGNTALAYYRTGIETAGHNIANANVEGFARQRVNTSTAVPINDGVSTVGGGMKMDSITRIRNLFLDAQYRAALPTLGYWETRADAVKNLELYAGQISGGTFQTALDTFWSSLENLHIYPDLETSRQISLSDTNSMIASLLETRSQFDVYRSDLNEQVADMVKEANSLIDEIALLCKDIEAAVNKGENPNDMLDRRDLLAERLCKLTGATVGSPSLDETDGDYKIDINGKLLVQGGAEFNCDGTVIKNVRHLVLVPMVGNSNYYDVQIEYNQYDHVSDYSVASAVIERGATNPESCSKNGTHELFVERLSNGKTWTVGGAKGILQGGERLDTIYDKYQALGISGSFSLQVGNAGVKASSGSFADHAGVVKNGVADGTDYEFRIAAGEFETYVRFQYLPDAGGPGNAGWLVTRDGQNHSGVLPTDVILGPDLTVENIRDVLAQFPDLSTTFDATAQRLEIEAANTDEMRGHLLSITDIRGTLAADLGIANQNPAVEITVTEDDSLATIANKINAAYQTSLVSSDNQAAYATNPPGTAPSRPEEWLHASVVAEPNGSYYIALTSDVSGEANRINVLPGEVCGANGDFSVAKLLGFTDSGMNKTSYMQLNADANAETTIDRGDAYVNDAYFIYDGKHFLSESNSFADARIFKTTDKAGNLVSWDNPMADSLDRFGKGIRLNLHGLNHFYDSYGLTSGNAATIIRVEPHLTNGEIFAMLESRDDMVLGLEDYLDDLAYEMATEANAVHYSGHGIGDNLLTTGTAYFGHISARYGASKKLTLNSALEADLSLIATGSGDGNGQSRGVGDGDAALRMAQLKQTRVLESGSADFDEYFRLFVADIGSQGYTANYMLATHEGVCDQLQAQRDSVMGVSTDEEMLDIIKFQQGVGAISRYMTALDDMLDRVINGMGV
ncbi:MAG: flagellar hook-associated protein FlgK [Synergistaceae bacterium]|jgi:flagellar hook-associated protein 1 FlgK|nr:flagellar hook-associated protein FlgK [Synergistaceae bacterium]